MIGLDVGARRIGVAVSDPDGRLAVPLRVFERQGKHDTRDLAELIRREAAERVVIGLPVSLDGSIGQQALDTKAFAEQLRGSTPVEVVLYDERLSSVEADHYRHAAGARARNAKGRRDEVAATIILQAYLDSLRAPPLPPVE